MDNEREQVLLKRIKELEKENERLHTENFWLTADKNYRYDPGAIASAQLLNLRTHFQKLVNEVLGPDYYNEGCDTYSCDEFTCRDLVYAYDNPLRKIRRLFNHGKRV